MNMFHDLSASDEMRKPNAARGIGIKAGTFAATLISTRGAMET